jgi:hypothetical protein
VETREEAAESQTTTFAQAKSFAANAVYVSASGAGSLTLHAERLLSPSDLASAIVLGSETRLVVTLAGNEQGKGDRAVTFDVATNVCFPVTCDSFLASHRAAVFDATFQLLWTLDNTQVIHALMGHFPVDLHALPAAKPLLSALLPVATNVSALVTPSQAALITLQAMLALALGARGRKPLDLALALKDAAATAADAMVPAEDHYSLFNRVTRPSRRMLDLVRQFGFTGHRDALLVKVDKKVLLGGVAFAAPTDRPTAYKLKLLEVKEGNGGGGFAFGGQQNDTDLSTLELLEAPAEVLLGTTHAFFKRAHILEPDKTYSLVLALEHSGGSVPSLENPLTTQKMFGDVTVNLFWFKKVVIFLFTFFFVDHACQCNPQRAPR